MNTGRKTLERKTTQTDTILATLKDRNHPITANELLDLTRKKIPSLGQSTVYRALRKFCGHGTVKILHFVGSEARYVMNDEAVSHRFQCRSCKRILEVKAYEEWFEQIVPKNFKVEWQDIVFWGTCEACDSMPSKRQSWPSSKPSVNG